MCNSNSKTGSSSKEVNKTSTEDMWSGPEDWMREEGRGVYDKYKGLMDNWTPYTASGLRAMGTTSTTPAAPSTASRTTSRTSSRPRTASRS
jgi:hypothetical protein